MSSRKNGSRKENGRMKEMEEWKMGKVKRWMAGMLAIVLVLAGVPIYGMEVRAAQSGDFEYKVNEDGNSVTLTKYNGDGGDVAIPAEIEGRKVIRIGDSAFSWCMGITGITIPNGVMSIGVCAFQGCTGLTSVTIPNRVTSIGAGAFRECSGLTSITIPNSVTNIGDFAFQVCTGLTSITIPDSVTSIGAGAFYWCSSLTSITIPNSVKSIGDKNFVRCDRLDSIKVEDGNTEYDSRENCNAIIETESNVLILGCKTTVIPNSVTSIGGRAFQECVGLTSITIPNSVTSIGESAFLGCSALMRVTIPNSVKNIGEIAFGYSMGEIGDIYKNPDFVICGEKGSAGETYANKNGFTFEEISENDFNSGSIAKAEVTLSQNSYTYDGWAKTPAVTVKLNGKTLKADTDYMVIYSNNIDIGTAKVIIVGKGNYTGNKTVNFTIVKATEEADSSITCKKTVYKVTYGAKPFKINVTSKSKLSFTSSNRKVVVVDKNTGKVIIKGAGVATITVRAGKNSVKVTVKVSPKKQSLKSAKVSKGRKLILKWAKDKNATGYQVQISTDKNFKKIAKQKNVTKNSYTLTQLKARKKYYVRVRSYKKSGMETLYGAWSNVKQSGKVKK